jgi:nucleoside-diphosphate-sugar epimerase
MDLKNKTILVTGGAGVIGSHLIKRLITDFQCEVIVIDDLSSGHDCLGDLKDDVYFHHTSILNDDVVEKIFMNNDIDIVFHLAALFANQKSVDQPKEDLMVNGMGTLKILQYAQKYHVDKVIFTSSSCVYGNKDVEDKEDDYEVNLDTPYAITKLLGEKYCDYFYHHYGVNTVVLRIFNCYGPAEPPGKYRNVIPNFFKNALNKRILTIYGTGEETRSYTYVDDTVEMIIKAAIVSNAVGQIINVGTDVETKTIDLAKKINDLCNNQDNITYIPQRGWDTIKRRKANIEKAKKIFGCKPLVGLDEGLRKTYDWFIQHPEIWKDN